MVYLVPCPLIHPCCANDVLRLNNVLLSVQTMLHLVIGGHFGSFHNLIIVINAALNMEVQANVVLNVGVQVNDDLNMEM